MCPISKVEWEALSKISHVSNKELLEQMEDDVGYSTTQIQTILNIQHPAALQRLKKLKCLGYVEKKGTEWFKLKKWEEIERKEWLGFGFGYQ